MKRERLFFLWGIIALVGVLVPGIVGTVGVSGAAGDPIVVDSNDPEVTVQLVAGRLVDLNCKAEEGAKIWIFLEIPSLFPGMEFARPGNDYCEQNGRYVFLFSDNEQLSPQAQDLYYSESSDVSKIRFGLNDLSGLETLVISVRKGELSTGLETIQTITLLPPGEEPSAENPNPPTSPVKLIFIHHSTGENWLADESGGLGIVLRDNNYFVSDTNYGWGPDGIGDRTDIGHWYDWFVGPNSGTYTEALYNESERSGEFYSRLSTDPGGENEIVMFKSCFPNSSLEGNPSDSPTTGANPLRGQDAGSEAMTVGNAKGIYNDLLSYFATRRDKLFVVITAPPLSENETDAQHAANARAFNNWLVYDYLDSYPHKNVAVFDFYNVLTSNGGDANTSDAGSESGNHHRWWSDSVQHTQTVGRNTAAYPSDEWDSHPSAAGGQKAAAEYVELLNIYYHCWKGTGACPSL